MSVGRMGARTRDDRLAGVPLAECCKPGTQSTLAEGTKTFTPEGSRRSGRPWRCGFGAVLAVTFVLSVTGSAWAATAWVYVANQGSGTVTPIEAATNKPGAEIKVGTLPAGVAVTPDGKTAYVANDLSGTVTPIEVATNKPGPEIKVGGEPRAVAVTPDGKTAYVANQGSGTVTPIEVATNKPGPEIGVGSNPVGIAVTPDGKTAYVANFESGTESSTVTPIEVATNKPGPPIKVGGEPIGIAVTPDGKTAYVANAASGTVTPIEVATNKPGAEIKVGGEPFGVAVTPDGKTAYVANLGSGTVTPIEVATNTPGPEIKVGFGPFGVAVTPDSKTAYVANSASGTVTPIEVATNKPGGEITVGSEPGGIAVTRIFQAPTVTKVSATSGPVTGDKVVTITGTNLSPAAAVEFGGVPANTYFINEAATEIAALSPVREVAGTVDVTVRTPGGTSKTTTKDHYKYLPVITSIKPNSGPAGVEQQVEILGAGFKPAGSEIFFGATFAGNAECFTPTFCAAYSPALPKGKFEVKVKVNGLTTIKTKAALFTSF
ncbi:MAG: beta-propeller repeat protein [Solirubrobacterales bacterium]|jgi:YVTN family beta-propeller protein|nr:beta-propeller repeat protein [Solirubrobacterales bacterium]